MHNTAFRALKVPAEYQIFSLKDGEVEPFFKDLRDAKSPIFGLNVTVPYKEKVIPFLDNLSPFAQKVGAVNTVTISPKRRLTGYNTDGPGFLAHLVELGVSVKGKRVAILGAGGASRAVISSLCLFDEKPEAVRVFDIDVTKAEHLVSDLGSRMDVGCVQVVGGMEDLNIDLCDMLINATPIGLRKEDKNLIPREWLHPHMFVYDLIYNPRETALVKEAKAKGAKVSNGLGMLFYQGVLAFQHWSENQLPENVKEKMRKALEEGKVV